MRKIILILIFPILSFAQSKSVFPLAAPTSFGINLAKIIADCPSDFENITEAIKDDSEEKELRDYSVNISLPFADSCYIYESIDESRGVISIYCAHFGTFTKKEEATKAFKSILAYLDSDKKSLAGFKKLPLDDEDDEKYQEFRKSFTKMTDILLELTIEIDNLIDPKTKKTLDIWEVKLKVLEDFKEEK